jgi:hypothetical protein
MCLEEERELAGRARERQIERLRMSEIQARIERVSLQRTYNNQLLALGEISHRRDEQGSADLDSEDASLRTQMSNFETRIVIVDDARSGSHGN